MIETLKPYIVSDAMRAQAYENSHAAMRACLKNAIAMHSIVGEGPSYEYTERNYALKGYALAKHIKPAPWLLCICPKNYNSPARLIAALMPALLAQVPKIIIVHATNVPHESLLLAHELMGIEHIFAIEEDVHEIINDFMASMYKEQGQGRVMLLAGAQDFIHTCKSIKKGCASVWMELTVPIIYANISDREMELLKWAQPDATFCQTIQPHLDAVYGHNKSHVSAWQSWDNNMEACFVHPNLLQGFFHNHCLHGKILMQDNV